MYADTSGVLPIPLTSRLFVLMTKVPAVGLVETVVLYSFRSFLSLLMFSYGRNQNSFGQ